MQKALRIAASARNFDDVYSLFLDEWSCEPLTRAGRGSSDGMRFDLDFGAGAPDAVRMMYCDAVSYLPDDIIWQGRPGVDGGQPRDPGPVPRSSRRRACRADPA